jgi:hypothetical protein
MWDAFRFRALAGAWFKIFWQRGKNQREHFNRKAPGIESPCTLVAFHG